ncbi:MAG TPA: alpha/beta hydrolase [Gemmatimonadales bacterium]|nr:alpha/beta hydrolase [Gemmatimonadales bacterium]
MAQTPDLGFIHRYLPGSDEAPVLLLLHGTGGDEDDLLPLGEALLPGAGRLSPRGKVLENGMPRFFRRLAEGVFDLEDLQRRTHELADFVDAAGRAYGFGGRRPIAVGLSNGANIAAAMLLLRPGTLGGALLLRPMVPLVPETLPALDGVPIQIHAGEADPLVPRPQSEALAKLLADAGASVKQRWIAGGHALTREDLEVGKEWFGFSSLSRPAGRSQ